MLGMVPLTPCKESLRNPCMYVKVAKLKQLDVAARTNRFQPTLLTILLFLGCYID